MCIIFCVIEIKEKRKQRLARRIPKPHNIKKLHITKFKDITETIDSNCILCLADYLPQEYLVVMPCSSLHCFHEACIQHWLLKRGYCPLCQVYVDDAFQIQE